MKNPLKTVTSSDLRSTIAEGQGRGAWDARLKCVLPILAQKKETNKNAKFTHLWNVVCLDNLTELLLPTETGQTRGLSYALVWFGKEKHLKLLWILQINQHMLRAMISQVWRALLVEQT